MPQILIGDVPYDLDLNVDEIASEIRTINPKANADLDAKINRFSEI